MQLKILKLKENAIIPTYASPDSAGADLYACTDGDITILPHKREKICTGIAVEPERKDVVLLVYGRSGLGAKHGIAPANCVGVVDSDYRGELMVYLQNSSDEPYTIHNGDRIAQLVITPVIKAEFEEVSSLGDTERGASGFGSSGR